MKSPDARVRALRRRALFGFTVLPALLIAFARTSSAGDRKSAPPSHVSMELRDCPVASALSMALRCTARPYSIDSPYRMGDITLTVEARTADDAYRRLRATAPIPLETEMHGGVLEIRVADGADKDALAASRLRRIDLSTDRHMLAYAIRTSPPRRAKPARKPIRLRTAGVLLSGPKRYAVVEGGVEPFTDVAVVKEGSEFVLGPNLPSRTKLVATKIERAGVTFKTKDGHTVFAPLRFATRYERMIR